MESVCKNNVNKTLKLKIKPFKKRDSVKKKKVAANPDFSSASQKRRLLSKKKVSANRAFSVASHKKRILKKKASANSVAANATLSNTSSVVQTAGSAGDNLALPSSSFSSPHELLQTKLNEYFSVQSKKLISKVREFFSKDKTVLKRNLFNETSIKCEFSNLHLHKAMNASKMKDQNFIQCNYTEKFANGFNYLHVKQYPNTFLMSICKPEMDVYSTKWVHFSEDTDGYEDILLSINNEEIPIELLSIFQNYSDLFVFDLRVVLKKELMSNTNAVEPILSTTVILNPTVSVVNFVVKTIVDEIIHIRKEIPIGNELHFEMSALLEEFKQHILKEEKSKIKKSIKEQNKLKRKSGLKVRKKSEKQYKEEQTKKKNKKKKPIEKINHSEVESKLYSVISGPLYLEANEIPILDFKRFLLSYKTSSESKPLSSETRSNITPEVRQEKTWQWQKTSFKYVTQSSQDIEIGEFLNFNGKSYNYNPDLSYESSDFGVKKVHDECSKNVDSDIHDLDNIHDNDKEGVSDKRSFAKEGDSFFDHDYNKNLPFFKNAHNASTIDKKAEPLTEKSHLSANHIPSSAEVKDGSTNRNPIFGYSSQESVYFIEEIMDQSDNELPYENSGETLQIAPQPIIKDASSTQGSNIDEEEYEEDEDEAAFSNISSD